MSKTQNQFKDWIRKQVDFYAPILQMELHEIKIKHDKETTYLSISCTYPYLDPTIKFSTDAYETWAKGEMKRDRILHELCHILTDPLYVKAIERYSSKGEINDERERLTDMIAAIVRRIMKQ